MAYKKAAEHGRKDSEWGRLVSSVRPAGQAQSDEQENQHHAAQ
jgi:hypothetical protein